MDCPPTPTPIATWLPCLVQLLPPRGVLQLGAAAPGLQPAIAEAGHVLAVDISAERLLRLQPTARLRTLEALVAGEDAEVDLFQFSLKAESGICPPEALRELWPNLRTLKSERKPAISLRSLVESRPPGAGDFNWVVLDALPAGELLRGAGALPAQWDVLLLRALRETPAGGDPLGLGLDGLQTRLAAYGLRLLAVEEGNQPKLVRALFARDERAERRRAQRDWDDQKDQLARTAAERQARLEKAVAELAEVWSARKVERENAAHEIATLGGKLQKASDDQSRMVLQHERELAALKVQLQGAADELAQVWLGRKTEREGAAQQIAAQLARLDGTAAELAGAQQQIRTLHEAVVAAKAELEQSQSRGGLAAQRKLATLEARHADLERKDGLLEAELDKANSQMELIKDLLLGKHGS